LIGRWTVTEVYELWHEGPEDEFGSTDDRDAIFIGIYSTEAKARAVLAALRERPEFKDRPGRFEIHPDVIDRLGWPEGFARDWEKYL
jgi:hypothetical protein